MTLWETLSVSLTVAAIVFVLNLVERQCRIRRENKASWAAIAAEARLCSELADMYVGDKIKAPSYRLPTNAYDNLFPKLLGNNGIRPEEITRLQKFYTEVRSVNRGLDNASEHHFAHVRAGKAGSDLNPLLEDEYGRTLNRASRLVSANGKLSGPVQNVLKKRGLSRSALA